ncbi:MAG TPA: hypothetical protein VIP11_22035 [Gemmatimonadaceae bacterium]
MPAVEKVVQILGLLAKPEAVYGTPVALSAATDGLQMQFADRNVGAPLEFDYAFDGNLGPSVSNLGNVAGVAPSGLSLRGSLPFRCRTGGAAYSASVTPSLHNVFKASGFDAAVVTTVSAEKWTYSPTAAGVTFTSLCAEMYARGEKWAVAGIIGNLKMDAPDTKPGIWTFDLVGLPTSMPVDAGVPAITYPLQSVSPPLASSILLTLGGLSTNARVLSHSYDTQRTFAPRVIQSANGAHLGFVPIDRNPILKVTLEATAAVTADPYTSASAFDGYRLRDTGKVIAASVKHGSAQYFRHTINMPQAQVIDCRPGNKDSIATVELTLRAHNSSAAAADDVNIVFD